MLFFIMFPLLNGFIFRLQMNYDDALPLNKNFLHWNLKTLQSSVVTWIRFWSKILIIIENWIIG